MAIQTQGHQVQVMPQFTPVNPNLMSFNPTQVTSGVLSAFQVADTYKKLKAFEAAQKELDDTREGRVGATNSRNKVSMAQDGSIMSLLPRQTQVSGLQLDNQIATLPLQGQHDLGNLTGMVERQPMLNEIALGNAQAAFTTLDDDVDTKINQSRIANVQSGQDMAIQQRQGQVVLAELEDKLANAKSDKDRLRAYEDARLELTKANAENALAEADYKRAGGSQRNIDLDARANSKVAAIQRSVDAMDKKTLPDGRTLNVYINETYNPDGSRKTNFFGLPIPKSVDGEKLKKNRDIQQKRLDEAVDAAAADEPASSLPTAGITPIRVPGIAASQAAIPVNPNQAALDWVKNNPNDPRVAAVLAKLGITQ